MEKYYIYKIDSEIDTFSQFEAGVNFKFETTTLKSSLRFKKNDLIIGFRAPSTYYVLLVDDFYSNELSLRKKIEIDSEFQIHLDDTKIIKEINVSEYSLILNSILEGYFDKEDSNSIENEEININVIDEFVDWFIKLDGSKHNYFSSFYNSNKDKFKQSLLKYEEVYYEQFGKHIFSLPIDNPKDFINDLERNLYVEDGKFFLFSQSSSTHRPRAILGKSNYLSFLKEYNSKFKVIQPKDFDQSTFIAICGEVGLIYSNKLLTRFISSLLTKPFLILTGLSGSGKTKLAQAFVHWICQDKSQYRIIPVGADWTNREPLLGYPNALDPEDYVKPDNGVIDLMIEAQTNSELPYFLVLDEMNLSHVERYFADFLSVMESDEEIPLHDGKIDKNGVPSKLKLPPNLFIIGTVNIDETTNMFSPKVLDRANTIEFRIDDGEMEDFLGSMKELDVEKLYKKGANMAKHFVNLSSNKSFATEDVAEINSTLLKFFGELKKTGAEFGYRTATEIMRLIHQLTVLEKNNDAENKMSINEKIDIAIMQKLLPKLHGSRRKLCPILETLGGFCVKEEQNIVKNVFEKEDFSFYRKVEEVLKPADGVLYPLSLEKISRMYNGAIDNGFTSFAEA